MFKPNLNQAYFATSRALKDASPKNKMSHREFGPFSFEDGMRYFVIFMSRFTLEDALQNLVNV